MNASWFPMYAAQIERQKDLLRRAEHDAKAMRLRRESRALDGGDSAVMPTYSLIRIDRDQSAGNELVNAPIQCRDVLRPLVEGTLQAVKSFDRKTALTGPLTRGDVATVRRHLRALKRVPRALRAYRLLGVQALALLEKRGGLQKEITRLRALLEEK